MIDENGNETALTLTAQKATVSLTPTPVWVVTRGGRIETAKVGPVTYTDAPSGHRIVLDDFQGADWAYSPGVHPGFAANDRGIVRLPGAMQSERVESAERGSKVWSIRLTEPPADRPLVRWYGVFAPPEPITIPGKARALGIYARGNSGWGRIVYEVVDAKGETYLSCGAPNGRNCDDTHSWSYLNFDGWRYMEFPLPGNAPGDGYRECDSAWWSHAQEGLVDLPLKLSRIIVELPTHQLYVDELLPVEDPAVALDDLMAVYESAAMASDAPVMLQRAAATPVPAGGGRRRRSAPRSSRADLMGGGLGEPPEIVGLGPSEYYFDGTRARVSLKPIEGAREYQVWVSVYPDCRDAQLLGRSADNELLVTNLKPDLPLYFFATYSDAAGKMSKPSAVWEILLGDFLAGPRQ